jgi:Leucine-rich repeat (LRR) protein
MTAQIALRVLNLEFNKLGDACIAVLATGIRQCKSLASLNLYSVQLTDVGAASLAHGLRASVSIQKLSLGHNDIGPQGAIELAEGIRACTSLTYLDLHSNHIGDDGAAALFTSMRCVEGRHDSCVTTAWYLVIASAFCELSLSLLSLIHSFSPSHTGFLALSFSLSLFIFCHHHQ